MSPNENIRELKELIDITNRRIQVARTDVEDPEIPGRYIETLSKQIAELIVKRDQLLAKWHNREQTLHDLLDRRDELHQQLKVLQNREAIARLLKLQKELAEVSE